MSAPATIFTPSACARCTDMAEPRQHVGAAQAKGGDVVVSPRLRQVHHRRVGGHEVGALLLHEGQRLVGEVGPVLDAAHAGADGGERPLLAVRVGLHGIPRVAASSTAARSSASV